MTINFIYKANWITNTGGVVPKGGSTENLGKGCHSDWYLGETTDPLYFDKIREFNPFPVTQEIADGFNLIGLTEISDDPESDPRPLTAQEISDRDAADNFMEKISIRANIESSVGDICDLVSDMSKRISLLETAMGHMMKYVADSTTVPTDFSNVYSGIVDEKASASYKDTTDVCGKSISEIMTELKTRNVTIADMLDPYYNS